ncbi:hypothetical protein MSG28_004490 [Choristoneura fumiferana]|uniref:Uncharacterized protein n=1 Tax=Choristoneura fumiferana TaxID=7141 RepID=A0ACC0K7E8_CHOFU|nr:hypothetical protein MSG28_004490 [Choristoneura fumiferana]
MADERDFNDILVDIFVNEETEYKNSFEEGLRAGKEAGNPEGYHLGYHRGAELGKELVCSNSHSSMDSTMFKLRSHIDAIVTYLTPLLPLANCHMVEFLTEKHWERLLPRGLRETLDGMEMDTAVELFWSSCENNDCDKSELSRWVHAARSHCLAVNNQYCLSVGQFENRIKSWGGEMQPEIRVKDFMSSKKSYEVSTMSRLLSSLYHATGASCSVEAGGGRGHLFAAATLAYRLRCLTDGREQNVPKPVGEGLHRFAKLFVTEDTDLAAVVKEKFPELEPDDARILLTVLNVPCCYHLLTEDLDSSLFDVFQINYGVKARGGGSLCQNI